MARDTFIRGLALLAVVAASAAVVCIWISRDGILAAPQSPGSTSDEAEQVRAADVTSGAAPVEGRTAAHARVPVSSEPSIADFAVTDRRAVREMLDEPFPLRWPSPRGAAPRTSRDAPVTILARVSIERVVGGGVHLICLSDASAIGLEPGERVRLPNYMDWARERFQVEAIPALAAGEERTVVGHRIGYGFNLWKRFLLFAGPQR